MKELAIIETVTDSQINKYLESMGNKLTESHRNQFIEICKGFNLNPFKREVYGISYGNNFNIIVGYEVYLKRAENSGQLAGWRAWVEGSKQELKACIEIRRKDWEQPFCHEVYIEEYHQNNTMWKNKPKTMLKKVAMAQGFRLAFPVELAGIPYTSDEMPDIKDIAPNKMRDITPEPQVEPPKKPKVHAVVQILIDKLKEKNVDVKDFALFAGFKSSDIESCQLALNKFDILVQAYIETKVAA